MTVAFSDLIKVRHSVRKKNSKIDYLGMNTKSYSLTKYQNRRSTRITWFTWPYLVEIESLGSNFLTRIDAHRTNQSGKGMKDTQKR